MSRARAAGGLPVQRERERARERARVQQKWFTYLKRSGARSFRGGARPLSLSLRVSFLWARPKNMRNERAGWLEMANWTALVASRMLLLLLAACLDSSVASASQGVCDLDASFCDGSFAGTTLVLRSFEIDGSLPTELGLLTRLVAIDE